MNLLRFSTLLGVAAATFSCARGQNDGVRPPVASFEAFQDFELQNDQGAGLNAADESCDQACQSLRQEFRYIVSVGREIYCYWDLKKAETGTDFDALAASLEASIGTGTSVPEYYTIVSHWTGAFHDGHVNIMPGDTVNPLQPFQAPIELQVLAPATDHERVIISKSTDPHFAAGDQVLAVNGVATAQALDQMERIRSGSTARMRRGRASALVNVMGARAAATDLKLKIKRGTQELDVDTFRTSTLDTSPLPTPTPGNTDAVNSVKIMTLPGGIGYLRMDTFSAEGLEGVLDAAMNSLAATRGLILDVRKNGGGTQAGSRVLARLISQPTDRYDVAERMTSFIYFDRPETVLNVQADDNPGFAVWHPVKVQPAEPSYQGKPVVVLTGPRCFSACDTFAAGLKANGLATVMGEGTGGGTGSPLVFKLPVSALTFRYSVVRGRTADGDWIEGHGTLPDVTVEPDEATVRGLADNQLDSAFAYLQGILGHGSTDTHVAPAVLAAHGSLFQTTDGVPQGVEEIFELKRGAGDDERHY